MSHVRSLTGCILAAAFVLTVSGPAFAADHEHLDKLETQRVIRRLEMQNDAFQERFADWIAERREERAPRAVELLKHTERLEVAIDDLKAQLRAHEDGWDVHDQAVVVVNAAIELREAIDKGDFRKEIRPEWQALRAKTNELARHFHVKEIEE